MRILNGDEKKKFINVYEQLLALPYLQIEQCFRKNGIIAGGFASYVSDKTNAYGDIDIFIPQTPEALEEIDGSIKRAEQCLKNGLELKTVHRVLKFSQSTFLAPYTVHSQNFLQKQIIKEVEN
jgi:hypothetical protein